MPWEFTEHHVRPNVFYWSPEAYKERQAVQDRRKEAQRSYVASKVSAWVIGCVGCWCMGAWGRGCMGAGGQGGVDHGCMGACGLTDG